jgi:hypothetical protein
MPQLWDRAGNGIRTLADLPLAEDIPIAFNSCRTGGRGWPRGARRTACTHARVPLPGASRHGMTVSRLSTPLPLAHHATLPRDTRWQGRAA